MGFGPLVIYPPVVGPRRRRDLVSLILRAVSRPVPQLLTFPAFTRERRTLSLLSLTCFLQLQMLDLGCESLYCLCQFCQWSDPTDLRGGGGGGGGDGCSSCVVETPAGGGAV